MEEHRRFVIRILLIHGLLLAGVLALVILASAEIYQSTRDEAIEQARIRQELLAHQTCLGIESYYTSIIDALGWIEDRQEFSFNVLHDQRTRDMTAGLERGAKPVAAQLVGEQLGNRVSALFVYNQRTKGVIPILPAQSTLDSSHLPTEIHDWLLKVKQTSVSRFMQLDGQGVSLVAAPFNHAILPATFRPLEPRLLVAVVPGQEIESNFLPLLTNQNSAATLVDSRLQVITSSNKSLIGLNLGSFDNDDARDMVLAYNAHPKTVTQLFNEPLSIRGIRLGRRMVTLAPVHIGRDEWGLFFAYPVVAIEAQVNSLFKRAVIWAGIFAISMTAILFSTAVQMIRFRLRLERVRHQILKRELSQARRIQEKWLPNSSTVPHQLDIAAINDPASHISGDFYNWFELPDGRQAIVIGDVTGHGMAAAFLMATTQLLVRNAMMLLAEPGAALAEVNRQLTTQMFHGQFVTMLVILLDLEKNRMEVASAGHPPPLIAQNGKWRPLQVESQLVLGVESDVSYPTQRFDIPDLSAILLYTDGVLDAHGSDYDYFGAARLLQALAGPLQNAQEIIAAVRNHVRDFCAGQELDDDLTMVAITLRKTSARYPQPRRLTIGPLS